MGTSSEELHFELPDRAEEESSSVARVPLRSPQASGPGGVGRSQVWLYGPSPSDGCGRPGPQLPSKRQVCEQQSEAGQSADGDKAGSESNLLHPQRVTCSAHRAAPLAG